jgi:hypothetical protein
MTLALAWIRTLPGAEELVMASDSRLRFGCAWDSCPKIFTLPRSDSAICFAGDTMFAYPIMEQVRYGIGMFEKSRSRAMDLGSVRGHLLRVMDRMLLEIRDLPQGAREPPPPDTRFIFAGYSWLTNQFRMWILHYDEARDRFAFATPRTLHRNRICLAGDHVAHAKTQILTLLRQRGKESGSGFDMEPLEVLREICRDPAFPEIGGAPQVVKIYRHMNCMPYAVFWPNRKSQTITFMGRPLLRYEMTSYMVIDPDSLETFVFKDVVGEAANRSVAVKIAEGVAAGMHIGDALVAVQAERPQ